MEYDIKKITNGNEREFNKFIAENYNKFYRFAYYYIGNREDAEDILQESFIKIFYHSSRFNFKSSFLTWCYKIIKNNCIDFKRQKNIFKFAEPIHKFFNLKEEINNEPDKLYERKIIKESIDKALDKLRPKEKEVFILKHYNSLSIKEISKLTDYTESNIKVLLFRAVNKLKKRLKNL